MRSLLKIVLLLLIVFLTSCSSDIPDDTPVFRGIEDFSGRKISAATGSNQEAVLAEEYPSVEILRFDTDADLLQSLMTRRSDAIAMDLHIFSYFNQAIDGLVALEKPLITAQMGFCFCKDYNVELREQFNAFLKELKQDGLYEEIVDRWINNAHTSKMPDIPLPDGGNPIRVATNTGSPPLVFMKDGEIVGFDAEIVLRFAAHIGRGVVWSDMNFSALIPSLVSRNQDMAVGGINITEGRKVSVDFSDPYYLCHSVLVIREENSEGYIVGKTGADKPVYSQVEDLYGKTVAATTGSSQESMLVSEHPQIGILRFDTDADLLNALLAGKCEGIAFDHHIFAYFDQVVDGITALEEPLFSVGLGACFDKGNDELRDQFNAFIKKIREDGTYEEIVGRWINNGHTSVMPDIPVPQDGKPLRVGTNTGAPPLVYVKNGELVGFDVEIVKRFAAWIGRPIVWSDMNFTALIPALVSKNQDMAMCGINITEERKQSVDFSEPYFDCHSILVVREENTSGYVAGSGNTKGESFFQSVVAGVERNIIEEDRYLLILDGLKITVIISLLSCLLGTLLGALVCWMRMSRNKFLRGFSNVYISLMRGMPVLVLLMIMFYVIFAGTSINPVMVAVITFGMNFAAYVSEMFRSAIESVDKGQTEAGIAMGFTPFQTFIFIVMPQAFKQVLPVFKGETISLVKTTSIVGFIAVQDLTKVGDIIRSRTFDAFFPLIMIAVLYFIVSWAFAAILDYIGKKAS